MDFVCLREKVAVEVDGIIHDQRKVYDQKRDAWLKSQGYVVIRIRNEELEKNREETLIRLRKFLLSEIISKKKELKL